MVNLKKYSKEITAALIIVILFFIVRLPFILSLPIFTDEAIYLHWAQVALHDSNQRFISLTDGKQPLYIWITVVVMKFITDPLLAGRLVSLGAGFITLIGIFVLTRELFKNRYIGLIASLLYAIYPFAIVYDKMALYDSLVGTFFVWGLYLTILLVRYVRLDNALILGLAGGLGVLNKTSGFFSVYLLPFSLLIFNRKQKKARFRFVKLLFFMLISVVLLYAMYSLLRLSPFFYIISQKDAVFIYPIAEWIKHPFEFFWSNFQVGMLDWFIRYFSIPFSILVILAFLITKKYLREKILLLIWFIIPFILLALFGKTLYPRYIFFMTLPLLSLAAFAFYELFFVIKNKIYYILICLALCLVPLRTDYMILFNFAHAPIPSSDVNQYNNDWPSGTGVKESIIYFKQIQDKNKITVFTQGTFGLMPYAYEIYFYNNPNFIIKGVWPIETIPPKELLDSAKVNPTYIVFYQPCVNCPMKGRAPVSWPLQEVFTVKKVAYDAYLTVYKVNP